LTLDNAHFTASGPYGIQFGTIVIKGAANVSFTANDPESLAALIAQTLSFEGFTGKFYVIAADATPPSLRKHPSRLTCQTTIICMAQK